MGQGSKNKTVFKLPLEITLEDSSSYCMSCVEHDVVVVTTVGSHSGEPQFEAY